MKLSFFHKVAALLGIFVLFAFVFVGRAQESSNSGKNLFLDFDQDGLSNDEEMAYGTDPYKADTDGDGYSDYTEISGGYDPLKPAPGDKLVQKSGNVTTQTAKENTDLTEGAATQLAGIMAANMGEGESVTLADVDRIVQDSVEKSIQAPALPDIDTSKIKIKDQAYKKLSDDERKEKIKQDAREYISAVLYVFAVQFPQITDGNKDDPKIAAEGLVSNMITSFSSGNFGDIDKISESGKKAVEQLYDIEVPETFVDVHIRGIQFANYAQGIKNNIKTESGDPLESISNLALAQGLIVSAQEFFTDIESRLNEIGLDDASIYFSN